MPKGPAMSMSLLGMITEPSLKMDMALSWFFASRRNQCTIIPTVESYVYIKELNQGTNITANEFCERIANSLQKVMIQYFDSVYVNARPENVTDNGSMFTCYISCVAIEDGERYDLFKSVLINNKTYELIDQARSGKKE